MNENEFEFLGNTIENVSIKYGIFLVCWASAISWISQSTSFTSWIPALIGIPIFIFGWLSRINPNKKKLFMHLTVFFGLIAFLGGLDFIRELISGAQFFSTPYATASKLVLLLSGALFCYLCLKSFQFARKKNKQQSHVKTLTEDKNV